VKLILIFLAIAFLALGCTKSPNLIKGDHIKIIQIMHYLSGGKLDVKNLSNPNKISEAVYQLNNAMKEPAYFKGQYILRIIYKNGSIDSVICNNNLIKINGLTYRMERKIDYLFN
jgi:hypothetical protein